MMLPISSHGKGGLRDKIEDFVLNDTVFIHHKFQLTSLLALQKNITKSALTYS